MKPKMNKLSLARETVRVLNDGELGSANGGLLATTGFNTVTLQPAPAPYPNISTVARTDTGVPISQTRDTKIGCDIIWSSCV